jgi:hypothetical protein
MSEPWRMEQNGGSHRIVVTKDLPGRRWKEILAATGCDLFIYESREVLSPC